MQRSALPLALFAFACATQLPRGANVDLDGSQNHEDAQVLDAQRMHANNEAGHDAALDVLGDPTRDAQTDGTPCAERQYFCANACRVCPHDANASGFGCQGTECTIVACRAGFVATAGACVAASPFRPRPERDLVSFGSVDFGVSMAASADGLLLAVADLGYESWEPSFVKVLRRATTTDAFRAATASDTYRQGLGLMDLASLGLTPNGTELLVPGVVRPFWGPPTALVARRAANGALGGIPVQTFSFSYFALAPDGLTIAAQDGDRVVFFERAASSDNFDEVPRYALNLTGRPRAFAGNNLTLVVEHQRGLLVFDRATARERFAAATSHFIDGPGYLRSASISPDGLTLAQMNDVNGREARVELRMRSARTMPFPAEPSQVLRGSNYFGFAVQFTTNAELLVTERGIPTGAGFTSAIRVYTR